MYLADRILKYGFIAAHGIKLNNEMISACRKLVAKSTCIDIQNVVNYISDSPQEFYDHFKDFPNVAPPFPSMFFEYKVPDFNNYEGKIIRNINAGLHQGVLINSQEIRNESDLPPIVFMDKFCGAKWMQEVTFFTYDKAFGKDHPAVMTFLVYLAVNSDGSRHQLGLTQSGEKNPWIAPLLSSKESFANMNQMIGSELINIGLATSFMHCKNISVEEERGQCIKSKNRNETRNDLMKVYTLDIYPIKTIFKDKTKNESFSKNSLHICRGHFKDYRDGSGLFGKHKGLYFWDMNTRGSVDKGVVVKNYAINP